MKSASLVLVFLASAAICAAQSPAPTASASTSPSAAPAQATGTTGRVSGTLTCTKPNPMHRVDVSDWPGHAATASRTPCTWTKAAEIAGDTTKDGYSVGSSDIEGTVTTERGSHVTMMSNGDHIFVAFRGKGVLSSSGAPQSTDGTWNFKGGDGKFARLQGMGTYRGKANADGSLSFAIEGNYRLAD